MSQSHACSIHTHTHIHTVYTYTHKHKHTHTHTHTHTTIHTVYTYTHKHKHTHTHTNTTHTHTHTPLILVHTRYSRAVFLKMVTTGAPRSSLMVRRMARRHWRRLFSWRSEMVASVSSLLTRFDTSLESISDFMGAAMRPRKSENKRKQVEQSSDNRCVLALCPRTCL